MNIMIALPGERYFAVPRDLIEKYAVTKEAFEREVEANLSSGKSVLTEGQPTPEVEGQQYRPSPTGLRSGAAVLGVRG